VRNLEHREFKRPESVLVIVYTTTGEVLMLRRVEPPDFWQSVTGSLRWGEKAAAAARRELREETGIDREPLDCGLSNRFPILPAWRSRYAPDATTNLEHVFRVECQYRPTVRLNPQEHSSYRWLPREEAAGLASSWTNREALLQFVPVPDAGRHQQDLPT
jgi:dihydroneopterin triphosphate diphosphatase